MKMLRFSLFAAIILAGSAASALTPLSFQTEVAFPNLTFTNPILLLEAPDNSNRIFVLERAGRIKVFPNSQSVMPAQVTTYLDITDRVTIVRDFALNGFDFHPDFATNGEIYVHYNWKNGADQSDLDYGAARISRFTAANPADNTISAATEEILHQHQKPKLAGVANPLQDHNGGTITFGPDGMLYVVFGDGGTDPRLSNMDPLAADPLGNAQNTESLLGKIIRIDVTGTPDPGLDYRIPTDNPFYVTGPAGATTRKEIWAYGFRNPWRVAFDPVTGDLIAVDVGAKAREEIDFVEAGKNYGWRLLEGTLCFPSPPAPAVCDTTGLTPPIIEHEWSNGEFRSLTGGYFYHGQSATQLTGRFLYGDYVWGGVWAMSWDGATASSVKIASTSQLIAGFGTDRSGEVYLLGYNSGQIFRFKADPAIYPTAAPDSLSATELVALNGQLVATDADSVSSYQIVNAPSFGSVNLTAATGDFVYTSVNLTGTTADSFTFKALDADGNESNIAAISVSVAATNDPATVGASPAGTLLAADTSFTIGAASLAVSDPDSPDAAVLIKISTAPAHGVIELSGLPVSQFTLEDVLAGLVTYHFTGIRSTDTQDSFGFTAEDESATATPPALYAITVEPTVAKVPHWQSLED
ncbi:hypothetical protein BH09SUM1_BH09SUM1_02110 [soil metagenome]